MRFRGVIFDMDGTITEPYLDFLKIRQLVNVGEHDLIDHIQNVSPEERARLVAILHKFEEDGVANAKLNRGARELLDYIASRNIPTALLTRNSRRSIEGVCNKLGLKFDVAISREDGPYKPAPDAIFQIAKQWQAEPAELLVVGDYKWDLLCAKNAGAPCAILTNGSGVPEWAEGAEFIIHELAEVIGILESLNLQRSDARWGHEP